MKQVIVLGLVFLLGCDSRVGSTVSSWGRGLFAEAAPASPVHAVVLVDASRGSSCEASMLSRNLDVVLTNAASRAGSTVSVWMLREDVAGTGEIAWVSVPTSRARRLRVQEQEQRRWVERSREDLLRSAATAFQDAPPRASPIAESIQKIVLTRRGSPLVVVSCGDGLQYTKSKAFRADFECQQLPSDAAWVSLLQSRSLFRPRSMSDTALVFVGQRAERIGDDRCAMDLTRALRVRDLWAAAGKAAGARVFFAPDIVSPELFGGSS